MSAIAKARREKRAQELAEKKAKLEALRKRRAARSAGASSTPVSTPQETEKRQAKNYEDVNDLVDELLKSPSPLTSETPKVSAPESSAPEKPASVENADEKSGAKARQNELKLSPSVCILDIPSEIGKITYHKGSQTDLSGADIDALIAAAANNAPGSPAKDSPLLLPPTLPPPALSPKARSRVNSVNAPGSDAEFGNAMENLSLGGQGVLNEEDRNGIINSAQFRDFFVKSARICERALENPVDTTLVYGAERPNEDNVGVEEDQLVSEHIFFDKRWSANRAVADIDWNHHYKELVLVAMAPVHSGLQGSQAASPAMRMGNNDIMSSTPRSASAVTGSIMHDPDGVVLLWSLHRPKTPEFVFNCQSPVTCALFDRFSNNFVLGATYSGQIVLWDMRASSRPVQSSPLSTDCHTHPVFCANIVGTPNSHEVVTVSTDGRLCTWNLGQLDQPAETVSLMHDNKDLAITAMSFPSSGDSNTFCAGGEDGCVYLSQVHSNKSQAGAKRHPGHHGPITGLDFGTGPNGEDVMLTSSMDWTVKLWSHRPGDVRNPLQVVQTFSGGRDCVYDARWCPGRPNTFCTIGGEGTLALWDIERDTEAAIYEKRLGEALNKARWSEGGERIAIGGVSGKLQLFRNLM